ncbi:MAG: hypothetical protein COA52_15930 [Hyphomicrobiales bacterium]|nr:MAG: hypothetical protein COA52_15930 [Hyphomicrobiales bacterium]
MKPPHPSSFSVGFLTESSDELIRIIGNRVTEEESQLIRQYFDLKLPPITSVPALSGMFGLNEGFIWSVINRATKHYRRFEIPKGRTTRTIFAPKVGLKMIQKWLSIHFQECWSSPRSVFGFVPGRSHLAAAAQHLGSEWVMSIDIKNFFPSTSTQKVEAALGRLGYNDEFSRMAITKLTCLRGGLAQGAPSSPILSNIVLHDLDQRLSQYTEANDLVYTRYADDIVISGNDSPPNDIIDDVRSMVKDDGWEIAESKTSLDRIPNRLKVHGLLVHGKQIRLTKGYRNKIRAYQHLLANNKITDEDFSKISGHIRYASSVEKFDTHPDNYD